MLWCPQPRQLIDPNRAKHRNVIEPYVFNSCKVYVDLKSTDEEPVPILSHYDKEKLIRVGEQCGLVALMADPNALFLSFTIFVYFVFFSPFPSLFFSFLFHKVFLSPSPV